MKRTRGAVALRLVTASVLASWSCTAAIEGEPSSARNDGAGVAGIVASAGIGGTGAITGGAGGTGVGGMQGGAPPATDPVAGDPMAGGPVDGGVDAGAMRCAERPEAQGSALSFD